MLSAKNPSRRNRIHKDLRAREMGLATSIPPSMVSWSEGNTLARLGGGRYVDLDRTSQLVRSTLSMAFSHDGRYFASTHGDHSVKVFEYPTGRQIACLERHPRTPWTVRFHPVNSSIVASGCLAGECCVWDVSKGVCIRRHKFRFGISCVSFSPDAALLAVTSADALHIWDYNTDTHDGAHSTSWDRAPTDGPGMPRELALAEAPFHVVAFHPSGTMLMTGEVNPNPVVTAPSDEQPFTLKLVIYRFNLRAHNLLGDPVLVVPHAAAYNDAGIDFSPCGAMLAACIPVRVGDAFAFHIAALSIAPSHNVPIGSVLHQKVLERGQVSALTNLNFSPTTRHLLAGFSLGPASPCMQLHAQLYDQATGGRDVNRTPPQVRVVDIYEVDERFKRIRSLRTNVEVADGGGGGAQDEINAALFSPSRGVADGVVYGTQDGRIRIFQQPTGPSAR